MKKRSAVFFDLDGTWFRWQLAFAWIVMCVHLLILPRVILSLAKKAKKAYKNRKGDFDEWAERQVDAYQSDARLRGVRVSDATHAAEKLVRKKGERVHVFVRELSLAAHELGIHRAIISGSPSQAVEVFANANGIHCFLGTEHPNENGRFTGGAPVQWALKKNEAVEYLAEKYDLDPSNSVAIGDSTSDIGMFEKVPWPICFNPSSKLLRVARQKRWPIVIEKKDVNLILKPDAIGRLVETKLDEVLPPALAENLRLRLRDRMWGDQSVTVH